MRKQSVYTFESDSAEGLDRLIQDNIEDLPDLRIINVSHSTTWDEEKKYVVYSACIALEYNLGK